MLRWALFFLLISLVAGAFGFTGIAVGAAAISKVIFFVAITLFLGFLVFGLVVGEAVAHKL